MKMKVKTPTKGIYFNRYNTNRYYPPSDKPLKEYGIKEGLFIWEGIRNELREVSNDG